jgi:hypothetical protein
MVTSDRPARGADADATQSMSTYNVLLSWMLFLLQRRAAPTPGRRRPAVSLSGSGLTEIDRPRRFPETTGEGVGRRG